MVTHFIFMSSSYSLGTRIALDYIVTDEMPAKSRIIFAEEGTEKILSIDKH